MAWDSRRPVPWARLSKEWLVYAGLISIVFLLFFRDSLSPGSAVGLLVSYPMYLALGAALAKLGYQRATIKQVREQRQAAQADPPVAHSTTSGPRRPPPTKRTSTGRSQHPRRTRSTRRR